VLVHPAMAAVEVWCRVTVVGPGGDLVGTWALSGPDGPDLAVVDGLARLRVALGRAGGALVLRDLSADLAGLLDLVGLRYELCSPADAAQHDARRAAHPAHPAPPGPSRPDPPAQAPQGPPVP
jgi:hypothetical protein